MPCTTRCPTALTDAKTGCASSQSIQQGHRRRAVVGGGKAAGELWCPSRIVDGQIRAAQPDAIDLPIELPPQRVACFIHREPDARRAAIDRQDALGESSLPQDSCVFQWDRHAVAVRHHSRRIVRWRAGRRHSRAVNVAARRAGQLANALHLLPHGSAAHDAVGVKLDSHRLGVEVIETDLNLKYVLLATSLNLHFAEA